MVIRIFVTGGTFDKEYNEITGKLFFKDTHLDEMLKLGRCKLNLDIQTLMMIDSLKMTNADRNLSYNPVRILKKIKLLLHTEPTKW